MNLRARYSIWKSALWDGLSAVCRRLRMRRRRLKSDLLRAELSEAVGRLAAASADLERDFLATGKCLEALNQQGALFLKDSERLIGLAVGQTDGKDVIVNATRVVEEPLIFLDECLAASEQLLTRLREDYQSIELLLRAETNLRSTMAPLKFMQTLFKIESAPLGEEAQTMFTALTVDIEQLHTKVCELFETKFRELERVKGIIGGVAAQLEEQTAALRKFVKTEKTEIQESLRKLSAELTANQRRDTRMRVLGQQVAREIQDIIVGLQFQDIINQKLQHTGAAVQEILARAGTDDEALHFLEQSCRLEGGQLQAMRTDLADAEKMVRTGVRNIQEHLSQADTNCLSLGEFGRITTSADGMIQMLFTLIDAVRRQVEAMSSRSAEIHQHLLPIRNMAAGLTSVVRDLSHRIHLIGLNAQVQAAQFNSGGGLEVLSARTSGISLETNTISESIATHLDQVANGLADSVKAFEELHTQALFQRVDLSHHGVVAEKDLHGLRDEALGLLHSVGDMLQQINDKATEAMSTVNYVATADEVLAALQKKLGALGEAAKSDLGRRRQPATSLVSRFHKNYTMASERQVFEQVLQAGDSGVNADSPTPRTVAPSDVELFIDLPAAEPPPKPAAPMATPATDAQAIPPPMELPPSITLPGPEPARMAEPEPGPRPPSIPGKPNEFGNNVELF